MSRASKRMSQGRSSIRFAGVRRVRIWAGVLALPVLFSAQGVRAGDDGPDLSPPIDALPAAQRTRSLISPREPIISTPGRNRRAPVTTTSIPGPTAVIPGTAVLAMPGLSVPTAGFHPSRLPLAGDPPQGSEIASGTGLEAGPGLTLESPVEMPAAAASSGSNRGIRGPDPVAIPDPILDNRGELGPLPDAATRRPPSTSNKLESSIPARSAANPAPLSVRRGRFFGLLPGPVVVPPASTNAPLAASSLNSIRDSRSASAGASLEAVGDATLKARIEKQAKTSVGDRARSIEVRVAQKTATVQARGVKFYQKRGVRKSLESLPALSGLRSTIEVLD